MLDARLRVAFSEAPHGLEALYAFNQKLRLVVAHCERLHLLLACFLRLTHPIARATVPHDLLLENSFHLGEVHVALLRFK